MSREVIRKGGLITEFSKNWPALFNLPCLLFFLGLFFWLLLQQWCSSRAGFTELRQDVQAQLAKAKERLAKVHMHEIAFNQY